MALERPGVRGRGGGAVIIPVHAIIPLTYSDPYCTTPGRSDVPRFRLPKLPPTRVTPAAIDRHHPLCCYDAKTNCHGRERGER